MNDTWSTLRYPGFRYANSIRRRRPQPGDKWHLDEVFIKVCGETHYLWRAVDQDGNVLDILVQSQRNAKAATRFFKKLLKGLRYAPRVMITDKLASYGAARKQMRLSIEHRQHKGLNNRAENSHQPTRQKERQMKKFKSPGKAKKSDCLSCGPQAGVFHMAGSDRSRGRGVTPRFY